MKGDETLRYLDDQQQAIDALIRQLDEVQVAFNAQFDAFKARHDARLDELTEQVFAALRAGTVDPGLRASIEALLPAERARLEERRQKVREAYLPQRRQAADKILQQGQAEVAGLRTLNPRLDREEEELKAEKAALEAGLATLNDEIRGKSRGLGVVRHFLSISRADRERQRTIGKLEALAGSLLKVRKEWDEERQAVEKHQAELQEEWQLESIAVARLQAELDQLDDDQAREDLALRRAIRQVLDDLKAPAPAADPGLAAGLQDMVVLNEQTDAYHEGLASVGGLIGLLGGIKSGLEAIARSVEGLVREQEMHRAYLKPLDFQLPARAEAFHKQWNALNGQFSDEAAIGAHPAAFSAAVRPLLEGSLSQASIEAMFADLGKMIERAAAAW
ncbi:MAG TPA: hypothetical protein VLC52_07410 [Anaerolineae bacterium]|nr:hypothetical protein [Anaerolineae bacterium]